MRNWSATAGAVVEDKAGLTALGEVLVRRTEAISAQDFAAASPITVHLDGAVSVRRRTAPYKGAMFAAYPGDVVFSKIDARHGAIGLIPPSIPKAVVTPEFPVFIPVADRLDGAFLSLLLRTGGFIGALRARATGTSGRKRITPDAFESLRIPLPSLEDQQRMAAAHTAAIAAAEALEAEAARTEAEALAAFEAALGLAAPAALPDRPVFVARFRGLDRWSHESVLRGSVASRAVSSTWSIVKLKDIGTVSYGLQKSPANRPGTHPRPYLRVANVQRDRLDLREVKTINVPDDDMARLKLEYGDLLLCEGNSPDLVGRGAIWRGEVAECVHQNHVLKVRLDPNRVKSEFVLAVINSGHGQAYFRSKAKRTTNLASINSTEVRELPLPLPPLETQQTLTKALVAARARAATLREQARERRLSARTDFEAAVGSAAP